MTFSNLLFSEIDRHENSYTEGTVVKTQVSSKRAARIFSARNRDLWVPDRRGI